jgi:hypothetical protein
MAMALTYCTPGAEVEKVLDYVSHKTHDNGTVIYTWKPSNPKRRGFIVSTKYPGDETFSSDCVEHVMVKFEVGKPPEKCLPTQLNLVRIANEKALMALKNEANVEAANNGLIDDMKKPIVTDQTGVAKGKSMSPLEAKEYSKK